MKTRFIQSVLVFMMVQVPDYGVTSVVKSLMRERWPCTSGKWIKVGSFRFWRRGRCFLRRGTGMTLDDLPSIEDGPERGDEYDPTYGFEPYWMGGDWVFEKRTTTTQTTKKGQVRTDIFNCGRKCAEAYIDYGWVCGRNAKTEYKSFENFCDLQSEDCSDMARWRLVYRGKCRTVQAWDRHDTLKRTYKAIDDLLERLEIKDDNIDFVDHLYIGHAKRFGTIIPYNVF